MLPIALLLLGNAHADCMSGALSVWPPSGATLPGSGQVVLQAYGSERPRLESLGDQDLALVRGDERIGLRRVQTLHGSFQDDQAVLVPERAPGAGRWTFELSGEPLTLWTGKAHEAVQWRFDAADPEPPTWSAAPAIGELRRDRFGCGPGVSVRVEAPTRDAVWVEATVRGVRAATTVRYPVEDGRIDIGHGMCSGLIELEQGRRYGLELVPIGADGRRGESAGPLEFVAP